MIQHCYMDRLLSLTPHIAARSVLLLVVLALTLFAVRPTHANPFPDSLRLQPGLASALANSPGTLATRQAGQEAISMSADSGSPLGRPTGTSVEREISSIATKRAAIWPISGVLLFLAVALASLNTRRGRRTPRTARVS